MRAPCCRRWFECAECHAEVSDHPLQKTMELVFACKQCKKVFRKDMADWDDEADSHCPHCDNKFILEAKTALDKELEKVVTTKEYIEPDLRDGTTLVLDPRMKQPTLEELQELENL